MVTCLCSPDLELRCVNSSLSSAGSPDSAVLLYRFTGENEVDLMSTFVPEAFRGRGVAALLTQVTRRTSQTITRLQKDWLLMAAMHLFRLPWTS